MKLLLEHSCFTIGSRFRVTDGEHGSVEYLDKGVRYLTAENIKKGYVDLSKIRYVSEAVDRRNARASVQEGDVLISIKGTLGNAAVAAKDLLPCNMNRDVAVVKPLSASETSGYLLAFFLMGKYGALQSRRGGSGGVQQMITLGRLRKFIVPAFGDPFCHLLKTAYETAGDLRKSAETLFLEAGSFLLEKLDMDMEKYTDRGTAVASLSESFAATGRLDAEYYQDRYRKLLRDLHAEETIGSACRIYDQSFRPDPAADYLYIELANIGRSGEIEDVSVISGNELPSRARRRVRTGQVLVSSIEGSLESCALVTPEYDGALCSTGFYVIDSAIYNSETLLVLLKSGPIQTLLKRGCSGTILTNISKDEFQALPLPAVPEAMQKELKTRVGRSFLCRRQSEELVEAAKLAVELAIEQDETAAVSWLEEELSKYRE